MSWKQRDLCFCLIVVLGMNPLFGPTASPRGRTMMSLLCGSHLFRFAGPTQKTPPSGDASETTRPALRWWGRVDGRDLLRIRRGHVWIVHEDGFPIVETGFRLERPLPAEPVTVTVRKIRGRGTVEVIEQPTRENNFTATVRIEDKKSGSDRYELEVTWPPSEDRTR